MLKFGERVEFWWKIKEMIKNRKTTYNIFKIKRKTVKTSKNCGKKWKVVRNSKNFDILWKCLKIYAVYNQSSERLKRKVEQIKKCRKDWKILNNILQNFVKMYIFEQCWVTIFVYTINTWKMPTRKELCLFANH